MDNGSKAHRALRLALQHPVSGQRKGYWQRACEAANLAASEAAMKVAKMVAHVEAVTYLNTCFT
jgi:hypothetical protein